MADKDVKIRLAIANPEVLRQLNAVTGNLDSKINFNLKLANPAVYDQIKELKDLANGGITLAVNTSNIESQLLKLEDKFRKLKELSVINIQTGSPEETLRNIQLELAKQFKPELAKLGYSNQGAVEKASPSALDSAIQAAKKIRADAEKAAADAAKAMAETQQKIAQIAKEELAAEEKKLAAMNAYRARIADLGGNDIVSPIDLPQRQRAERLAIEQKAFQAQRNKTNIEEAERQFREDSRITRLLGRAGNSSLGRRLGLSNDLEERELEKVAFQRGLRPNQIADRSLPLFDLRSLATKEAATEIGISSLFGGVSGGAGAAAGRALLGAGGGPIGVGIAAIGGEIVKGILEPVQKAMDAAKESAKEYQQSIIAISATLQSVNEFNNVGESEDRAESIQLAARSRLSKLGIGGPQEAAIISSITESLGRKGIQGSPEQLAEIAAAIGSAANVLAPDLAGDPSRTRRDIRDIFSGSANASRTTLGTPLQRNLPAIGNARTIEEVLAAVKPLGVFETSVLQSKRFPTVESRIAGNYSQATNALGNLLTNNPLANFGRDLNLGFSEIVNSLASGALNLGQQAFGTGPKTNTAGTVRPEAEADNFFTKAGIDIEGTTEAVRNLSTTPQQRFQALINGFSAARRSKSSQSLLTGLAGQDEVITNLFKPRQEFFSGLGGIAGDLGSSKVTADELKLRRDRNTVALGDINDHISRPGTSEAELKTLMAAREKVLDELSKDFAKAIDNVGKNIEATLRQVNSVFEYNNASQNVKNLTGAGDKIQKDVANVYAEIEKAIKSGASEEQVQGLKARAAELGLKIADVIKGLINNLGKLTAGNDPESFLGKREDLTVKSTQATYNAVLNGVPLDKAKQLGASIQARGVISQEIDANQSARGFNRGNQNFADFLTESSLKFKELNDAVTGASRALKNFQEDAELRALGREGEVLSAQESARAAGASEDEILSASPAGLTTDPERLKKNLALARLRAAGRDLEQGGQIDRESQTKLENDETRSEINRDKLPRDVEDAKFANDIQTVETYKKFAGTKLGDQIKGKAIDALKRIQASNKEQGVDNPAGEPKPEDLINSIDKQAGQEKADLGTFNTNLKTSTAALDKFAAALASAVDAMNQAIGVTLGGGDATGTGGGSGGGSGGPGGKKRGNFGLGAGLLGALSGTADAPTGFNEQGQDFAKGLLGALGTTPKVDDIYKSKDVFDEELFGGSVNPTVGVARPNPITAQKEVRGAQNNVASIAGGIASLIATGPGRLLANAAYGASGNNEEVGKIARTLEGLGNLIENSVKNVFGG